MLVVGDLHVESFGTWRDAEGRLVWGVNDFDEAWPAAYTVDLVRLTASAYLAVEDQHLAVTRREAREAMAKGGAPYVLAEPASHAASTLLASVKRRARIPLFSFSTDLESEWCEKTNQVTL